MLRLLLAMLLVLAGCGSDGGGNKSGDEPSKAAVSCREKWKDLEDAVRGRDEMTNPSALAPRWNNIVATAEYYAAGASGSDCGTTIEAQKKAMSALTAFSTKLRPYDVELRLDTVKADAEEYASSPRPPAPKPSPAKKGKKAKKSPRPPKPADVAAALKTLTQQAPLATQQQGPAWQQARVVELSDAAAVAKAVKDLGFLSSESSAYTACSRALTTIQVALKAGAKPAG
jgi:hypothetical protein